MKSRDRKDRDEELVKLATAAFRDHVIEERRESMWYLRQPNKCFHWCYITVLGKRAVVVWGDIDAVIFVQGSTFRGDGAAINWAATSSIDYIAEKAAAGTGAANVECYESEVAINDIEWMIEESIKCREDNFTFPDEHTRYVEIMKDTIKSLQRGDQIQLVHNQLYGEMISIDVDCGEWIYTIGRVVHPKVFYARAAVARLADLLEQENEPPAVK